MALGHQKAKHTARSESSFETFANLHPTFLPTDVMPACKGSKPCLKPSLLSFWHAKHQKTVAKQSEFLNTSTGKGKRTQVMSPGFTYLTHANFEIKLFFKSDQLAHIGAKIFFNPLLKTRLQQNMKHTCNYKWLKEAALCHPDKAARKCWLYHLPGLSLLVLAKSSLFLLLGCHITILLIDYK